MNFFHRCGLLVCLSLVLGCFSVTTYGATGLGSYGALPDRGLKPLPEFERDATRKAASDLLVLAAATPTPAKMAADAGMGTQHAGTDSADPETVSDDGTTAPDAGNFSGFDLEGIRPFMTCGQIEQTLLGAGYVQSRMFGFVKSPAEPTILPIKARGGVTCAADTVSGVDWRYRGTSAAQACVALVEAKLGPAQACDDEEQSTGRDDTLIKRTCVWTNNNGSVHLNAISDPAQRECLVELRYP